MGSRYEWEGVVRWILSHGEGDAWQLARALGVEVFAVRNMVSEESVATFQGRELLGYRASLPRPYANHKLAHGLGHIGMRRLGVADSEEGADYIAAATLMPSAAFRDCLGEFGPDMTRIASAFCVTETSAALRLGEVNDVPIAVVTPAIVRVRGPEEWEWGPEGVVRHLSKTGGPGLIKARLRDDRKRVMLRAL